MTAKGKINTGKSPSFQFYWKDWLSDQRLKRASKRAKGVWIDLMCISCDMPERGVFRDENGSLSVSDLIAFLTGKHSENVRGLNELLDKNILKIKNDGTMYVKRIYEDARLSEVRKAAGRLGGNPNLVRNLDNQNDNQNLTPSSSSSSSSSIKANISSFPDLAEYHISVCPAPRATKEFEGQIIEKFDDIEAVYGLEFTKALVVEFSHRSTRGDGMGLLTAAIKRGWMKSKLSERAADENLAKDKAAQVERDKLPVTKTCKKLGQALTSIENLSTEERKQKIRKQAAALKGA